MVQSSIVDFFKVLEHLTLRDFQKCFFHLYMKYPKLTNPTFIEILNLLLYYVYRAIKLTKGEYDILCLSLFKWYRFSGYKQFSWWIHNRLGKRVRKVISSWLYGVFAKNILQPMEVISFSRKAVTMKQENYMEITDVL